MGYFMKLSIPKTCPLVLRPPKRVLMTVVILAIVVGGNPLSGHAQGSDPQLDVTCQNNKISINARNVDIKRILSQIAERANIRISFPADIKRSVTLERVDASIKAVLRNLLIGWNHAVIYSRSGSKKEKIVEVIVFSKKKAQAVSKAQSRTLDRIKSYERQLDSLRDKFSKVDADSSRGKQYARRINLLEQRIEKLNK